MTQPISRRTIAKAGVWSAPVVAASAAVPAYAASKETPGVQYGVYVSVQNNGGYVGYASSNNTGTINPASPEAHFTAAGTAFRSYIYYVVCTFYNIQIMLYYKYCISAV